MKKPDKNFWMRFAGMLAGVFLMGFNLSLMILTDFGVDPCSSMNLAIAARSGLSFGTVQLVLNLVLLVVVLRWDYHLIGLGSVANMILVGYVSDFFTAAWKHVPLFAGEMSLGLRLAVFAVALVCFVIAAAAYMTANQGVAPYDAMPILIARKLDRVSFRTVRMVWDFTITVVALVLGGHIGLVTVGIVLLLGPIVGKVGDFLSRTFYKTESLG